MSKTYRRSVMALERAFPRYYRRLRIMRLNQGRAAFRLRFRVPSDDPTARPELAYREALIRHHQNPRRFAQPDLRVLNEAGITLNTLTR